MKFEKYTGNKRKIIYHMISQFNRESNDSVKITNYNNVTVLSEKKINNIYKISFEDRTQPNKIFYSKINIWDIIFDIL